MELYRSQWGGMRSPLFLFAAALLVVALAFGSGAISRADTDNNSDSTVLASVGDHQFTQREVDEALLRGVSPEQLYDLRRKTIDKLVDEYLIQQAAKKAGMPPGAYVAQQTKSAKVTDADARKFYDEHKAQIQAQVSAKSYDDVKERIIATLERDRQKDAREALMNKLRAENQVQVTLKAPRFNVASAGHPWSGGQDAAVTVVEFSDFQCPYCRAAENSAKAVRSKYGDKIKFVYMDFPLGFHEHAMDAARAAQCAAGQDKFWQYHDVLFADQSKLGDADLKATATKLGLDKNKFDACFDKKVPDAQIKADQAQGQSLGVTGTPTFFINGRELVGAQPPEKFAEIIDDEIASAKRRGAQQVSRAN